MIYFLAVPIVSRAVKTVAVLVASLVCVLLMGLPILGILVQPLAPFWLSGQRTVTQAGAPSVPVVSVPVVAVPTLAPLPQNSVVEGVIALARTWLGVRYQWGGCSRSGVDCSCFVRNVWAPFGVNMPRVTTDQVRWATPVAREQIQPGDLVFFNNTCTDCGANPTHVGLAIGGGQMIQAGDPVQISSYTSGSYAAHYASAGRVH